MIFFAVMLMIVVATATSSPSDSSVSEGNLFYSKSVFASKLPGAVIVATQTMDSRRDG